MYSTLFVVLLGMGTVFVGLILIIFLCKIMSFFANINDKGDNAVKILHSAPTTVANNTIQNKSSVIAAVSAVVAEELGTDISNIRIYSLRRV